MSVEAQGLVVTVPASQGAGGRLTLRMGSGALVSVTWAGKPLGTGWQGMALWLALRRAQLVERSMLVGAKDDGTVTPLRGWVALEVESASRLASPGTRAGVSGRCIQEQMAGSQGVCSTWGLLPRAEFAAVYHSGGLRVADGADGVGIASRVHTRQHLVWPVFPSVLDFTSAQRMLSSED